MAEESLVEQTEEPPLVVGRITVVDRVYQQSSEDSLMTESGFFRWLKTADQPYQRKLSIGKQWVKLDHGWLKAAGMMVLECHLTQFQVQPTDEQRRAAEARIIEVGVGETNPVPAFVVRPGESMRVMPADLDILWLRCRKGYARVTLTLFSE